MFLIRVRSSLGTQRFEVNESTKISLLKDKIREVWNFKNFNLSQKPDGNTFINDSLTLKEIPLVNGDMLFLVTNDENDKILPNSINCDEIVEDEIDKKLSSEDGWITRNRDPKLCQHGFNGRCIFCMPIPPWEILNHDPWKSDSVKFIPFHSYIRKLQSNSGCKHPESQKCLNCKSIDPPIYNVKDCKKHAPWPEAVCTECKPSACRIDSQIYRHVDNVEFETLDLVDKYLQYWRETGNQRCGYLYGKYVPDEYVPLGITCTVSAIYEPPQRSNKEEFILEFSS